MSDGETDAAGQPPRDAGANAGRGAETEDGPSGRTYRGLLGAFPYAARESDSWLFRSYALVAGALGTLVALLVALGVVRLLASLGRVEGAASFSPAFYVLVGLGVLAPLVAPVLLAARAHRRTGGSTRHDAALAAAGYCFLASLYVGLIVASPPAFEETPAGPLAPAVGALYDLPAVWGAAFPVAGAAAVAAAHRLAGRHG